MNGNPSIPPAPLVYIVVLTWNGKADTLECLQSLRASSYPNARILVVDNASTDRTLEAVQAFSTSVEVIRNSTNRRFAGGNNVGIRRALEAGADFVLLLNNDTVVDKDLLSELVAAAQRDPGIGVVGPKIYYSSDPRRIWYAGGKIQWWAGWISHVGIRQIDSGQYRHTAETDYVTGCCMLVRRDVIERIGLLDERYFMYGEDVDWCLRARHAGYRIVIEPRAMLWHKLSVSAGGHLSWFKNWNKLKSNLRLMWRYAKPYHWVTIPVGMLYNIVRSVLALRPPATFGD